ncbi:hypothetical protein NB311A_17264 [Nitrobacter sp. Nb-311A]|nr:hypothetical protein NB311A_17264 [Nitrobacter sp. Nb-311A]
MVGTRAMVARRARRRFKARRSEEGVRTTAGAVGICCSANGSQGARFAAAKSGPYQARSGIAIKRSRISSD